MGDWSDLVDLASERLGGAVLFANDEFFAPKESLLRPGAAEWKEGVYTDRGKWMDGWETRRRRSPGYDWCIVRLGLPGDIRGVVVDTSLFRGNYPESFSLEGCAVEGQPDPVTLATSAPWRELLRRTPLTGDSRNTFAVPQTERVTHVRLNIFPDGGVARLRLHGIVVPDWTRLTSAGGEVDLAAMENGGFVELCSDMFFGHRQNLILPGRSTHMGDGWETRRRRGAGNDWTIVRLGAPGTIRRVEVDTDHFKGNAPGHCSLEWCDAGSLRGDALADEALRWHELMPYLPVQPHARHLFAREVKPSGRATHVRLNIFPDGGVARLRLFAGVATGAR